VLEIQVNSGVPYPMFSPAFATSDDVALAYLPFSTDFAPAAWTDSIPSDEDFENELMTMKTDSAPSDQDFEDECITTGSHEVAQVENCTPLGGHLLHHMGEEAVLHAVCKPAPWQSNTARWTRIQQGKATKTLCKDLAKQQQQRSYLLAWVARKKKGKPFATYVEKQMLAGRLQMTIPQINNFFNNARKRFQKVSGGYVSWKKLVKSGCIDA